MVNFYDVLFRVHSSPVVELNRAVALAMRDSPDAGLVPRDDRTVRLGRSDRF
jgi:RNA polymerase sigma-70 factor, ECF subfamily